MIDQETNQSQKTGSRFFYGYVVVMAGAIMQLVMFGSRLSFGVFFKPLLIEFGWSRALISGTISINSVMQGLFGIVMGGLNDRLGPRVVMTLCGFLIGLGFMLMSQINTPWHLYLFYAVIIGIGMGGLLTPTMSTVARWFVRRRSVMAGIVIAGGGIGGIILPPLANWLISAYGWRDAYVITGALILAVIIIGAQFLKRDPAQVGQEPYGGNNVGEQKLDIFTEGLTLMEAVYTRQFWMSVGLLFCFGYLIMTSMLHIVPHATDIGISAAVAANILAALGGAAPVGGIVIGGIADRMVNRQGYIICFILMTAAMLWLLIAGEAWMLYLFAVVMGLGGGGAIALMSPLAAELFGIRSHGMVFGALLLWQTIGSAIGSFLTGHIFDTTGSYQVAFLICAALGITGLILSATLRPIKN